MAQVCVLVAGGMLLVFQKIVAAQQAGLNESTNKPGFGEVGGQGARQDMGSACTTGNHVMAINGSWVGVSQNRWPRLAGS